MKIRQAKKLLLRPWNKQSRYWLEQMCKESDRKDYSRFRDHRYDKARRTLERWFENYPTDDILRKAINKIDKLYKRCK